MTQHWDNDQPIYRQLAAHTVAAIVDGSLAEGDLLPSVRQVAVDFQVNPLTVSKAYQSLVDEGLVQAQRGIGMRVTEGARQQLLARERAQFINEEWPRFRTRMQQLGLTLNDLSSDDDGAQL